MPRLGRSRPARAYTFIGQAPQIITVLPTVALSGSGTLAAGGAFAGAAALSGSGTLTAGGALAGAAALSGSGTLTAAGVLAGAAALSGSGTLTAAPTLFLNETAALSGSGTLTAAGALAGAAALSGSGTLTAAGALAGAAALSGVGTLAVPGVVLIYTAALSGVGTLTATAVAAGNAALSGSGTLSVPGFTLGVHAALSGSGTLVIFGTGGVVSAGSAPAVPYAYPGSSQVAVAPPGSAAWQYLGTVGIVSALTYSFVCPGGADRMACTVMAPADYRSQLFYPGWQVRITRGGHPIWTGKLDEPVPVAGQGWTLSAVGDGNRGTDFAAVYAGTWPASIPDDPVNEAITRGLPWVNSGIGTPSGMWLGQPQDSGSLTITDLLNLVCTRGGLAWYANSQPGGLPGTDLTVFPLPTAVTRLLVVTDPQARTLGGDINTIWIRYQISDGQAAGTSATFGTTSVTNAASIAAHQAIETYVDLTSAGNMTAAQAQQVGNYILAIYQRASFAGPFTAAWGQLLNAGGAPIDPGTDQAGTVVRLILTDFGYGGEVTMAPITFIVGAYSWDDFAQKATITPYQVLDESLSGLLSLENTLLTPITTQQ